MTRRIFLTSLPISFAVTARAQGKYSGPRPPKKDIPYLLEAQKLIQTEVQQARQSKSQEGQIFSVPGANSTARTPLPEPIFLFSPEKIDPTQLQLYRFVVNGGRRDVMIGKQDSDEEENLRLTLRKLDESLYRIEASHMLDPGEYALSPHGSNTAFCFTVY